MSNNILNWNPYGTDRSGNPNYFNDFPTEIEHSYGEMFDELHLIGCSFENLEKALCTYSISGYKDNLIANYPTLSAHITSIIQPYE